MQCLTTVPASILPHMHAGWLEFFSTETSPPCTGDLTLNDCLGDQTVMVRLTAADINAG